MLGISFDSVEENKAFAEKFDYPFRLLSDGDRAVGMAYGACDSTEAGYANRITYLIDENGTVAQAMAEVNPQTQSEDLLALV